MSFFRSTKLVLMAVLPISLVVTAMILLDPSVAFAAGTGAPRPAAAKPLLAGLHPATLAAFQLLASVTALVAMDD